MPVPVPKLPITFLLDNGQWECTLTVTEIALFLQESNLEQLEYDLIHDKLGKQAIEHLKMIERLLDDFADKVADQVANQVA